MPQNIYSDVVFDLYCWHLKINEQDKCSVEVYNLEAFGVRTIFICPHEFFFLELLSDYKCFGMFSQIS